MAWIQKMKSALPHSPFLASVKRLLLVFFNVRLPQDSMVVFWLVWPVELDAVSKLINQKVTHHKRVAKNSSISPCSSQKHWVSSSGSTAGSKRADPPRTHPPFMSCNPRTERVTWGKNGSQGGRQWTLLFLFKSVLEWISAPASTRLSALRIPQGKARGQRQVWHWLKLHHTCSI